MAVKKILVTGSEGYIGSVLVSRLVEAGYDVTGLDTNFYKSVNLGKPASRYRLIIKDIRDAENINLGGFDAIIHLAALSNDPTGEIFPKVTDEINHKATVALAKKAKKKNVQRFIFSSSCTIYGISTDGEADENSRVNPLTAYARSKIAAEAGISRLADKNFCVGILRNATVYGYSAKFRNDLVVNHFVTCGFSSHRIKVFSDGTPWRPQIDIRDLSRIFLEFLRVPSEKINAKIINVGFKNSNFQVNDILSVVLNELKGCSVEYTGEHGKETRTYKVNFDRFNTIFPGFKQEWSLGSSIKDLVKRLKETGFKKNDFVSGKYMRYKTLEKLLAQKKLTKRLYWRS